MKLAGQEIVGRVEGLFALADPLEMRLAKAREHVLTFPHEPTQKESHEG